MVGLGVGDDNAAVALGNLATEREPDSRARVLARIGNQVLHQLVYLQRIGTDRGQLPDPDHSAGLSPAG